MRICLTSLNLLILLSGFASACDNRNKDDASDDNAERQTDFDVDPNGVITSVSAEIHPEVETILIVHWTQSRETLSTRIRFSFENDEWRETPGAPRSAGDHSEVLLGIPESTEVTFYFEIEVDDEMDAGLLDSGFPDGGIFETERFVAPTGVLPNIIPRPEILGFRPELAGEAPWLLLSVEDTPGAGRYYEGPFWILVIDRHGRIVWYYADLGGNPCMAYPRIARDGSHLYIEKRMFSSTSSYEPKVVRLTLDYEQLEEFQVPGLDDCIDVTDESSVLFNTWDRKGNAALRERRPDGAIREIWDCRAWAEDNGTWGVVDNPCYSNTVSWDPASDTVLMSMPYLNSVVEIDRRTGELLSEWGDISNSYAFEPGTWELEFNHFPNITQEGTLLVSTHEPGHEDKNIAGEHRVVELEIDRENQVLREIWVFGEGIDDWPKFKGEATRQPNGNTLVNYGTGGVIREVTPEKETAWHVKWDAGFKDDHFNKMVGHTILIDDLYPLCRGW